MMKITNIILGAILVFPIIASANSHGFCTIGGANSKVKIPCPLSVAGPAGEETFGGVVLTIFTVALAVVGSVAVAFLIYGGFRYITAYGNEEHAESAKKIMRQAMLGLVVVLLAFAMISVITNILLRGRTPGGVF